MKPYYRDNFIWWYNKDCRDMSELPDESVQMVCTSPPFWGLRRYAGLPDLVWGGDNHCKHQWESYEASLLHENRQGLGSQAVTPKLGIHGKKVGQAAFCSLCSAWKGSYGLELTLEMYVEHTIEILREIKRVLRPDGVVFWDIGDSYASGKGTCFNVGGGKGSFSSHGDRKDSGAYPLDRGNVSMLNLSGLKSKDLCLIPFRVAIAVQADGWWIRSVIIWSKNNPMPESVTDRPAESHEYILMLTKSGTIQYWTHRDGGGTRQRPRADYRWVKTASMVRGLKTKGQQELSSQEQHHGQDIDPSRQLVIEEVAVEPADWKVKIPCSGCNGTGEGTAILWGDYEVEVGKCPECGGKGEVKLWRRINLWTGHDYYWDADAVREEYKQSSIDRADESQVTTSNPDRPVRFKRILGAGRNIRTVWEFPTQPFPQAHFAVFPEKLPETCIKAATSEVGCCSKCGAPWARILDKKPSQFNIRVRDAKAGRATPEEGYKATEEEVAGYPGNHPDPGYRQTIGWQPTCSCNADKIPSLVLDPFLGAGTTLKVAKKLGRRGVGYELSGEYCALSLERNRQMAMELIPRG